MSSIKGYPSQLSEDRSELEFANVVPVGENKNGLVVSPGKAYSEFGTDAIEALSTTTQLIMTAHGLLKGDLVVFTSGVNDTREVDVIEVVDANTVNISPALPAAPSALDTVSKRRPRSLLVNADGSGISTAGAIQFNRDTGGGPVAVTVLEDTVTPANNLPLPVKLTSTSGDITITADNIDVQLEHNGATPDSVQIGDGTNIAAVSAALDLQVEDTLGNALLTTIDADTGNISTNSNTIVTNTNNLDTALTTRASEATLATLNAKFVSGTDIGDVTINNGAAGAAVNIQDGGNSITVDDGGVTISVDDGGASLTIDNADLGTIAGAVAGTEMQVDIVSAGPVMLDATGAAIGSDTTSIDGKTPALGAAVIAASSPVNIASDQVVPVSAASLPLPTGAATEATLATIDADTGNISTNSDTIAGAVSGSEMQVDVVASLPAGTNNIGDVDLASAIPAGANTIGAVGVNRLDVVQTNFVEMASTNIPGNATNPLELQASTLAFSRIQVADTGGAFYEIMSGGVGVEVREALIGPGSDNTVDLAIIAATRVSIRRVDSASALAVGFLAINYLA